ncbi:MAG TPA: hypothetical protein VL137_16985 [Polyangiaceae bacterium]|nr:hypothetical protein [Polyangiaceae bacterium]
MPSIGVMTLGLVAGLLLLAVPLVAVARAGDDTGSAADAPKDAPSAAPGNSAKPPKPGKIKLTHEARTVIACEKTVEDDKAQCSASQFDPAKSGAKVKISPLGDDDSGREAVSVELDNQVGKQENEITLAVGDWEIVWQGDTTVRDKFSVKRADKFEIALITEVGVCKLKGEECSLDKGKRRQSIEIPTERGL